MAYDERQIIQIVRILSVTLYIYSDIQRWYKNFDMNMSADVYTCCEYHKINRLEQQFYLHRRSKSVCFSCLYLNAQASDFIYFFVKSKYIPYMHVMYH